MITQVHLCVRYLMTNIDVNSEINDSLKVHQNEDGTFSLEWDKQDPKWSWLNGMTSKEISGIVKKSIEEQQND